MEAQRGLNDSASSANARRINRKVFHLERDEDESGVSGVGIVAEGMAFSNGKVVLSWLTDHTSIAIYETLGDLEAIHGHNGKTRIVMDYVEYVDLNRKRVEFQPVRAGRPYGVSEEAPPEISEKAPPEISEKAPVHAEA